MLPIVKVFTASKSHERELIGEKLTRWLKETGAKVQRKYIVQSSDSQFHCLSVVVFGEVPDGSR